MDIDRAFEFAGGILFLCFPLYFRWQQWRTKDWLTAKARVIEVESQSLFERSGNTWHLNLDADYAIEYEVGGKKYIQTPDIESNVRAGGIKIWKSPTIPKEFDVRYHPHDPNKYSIEHAYSPWVIRLVTTISVLLGLVLLYHASTQYGT